MYKNYFILLRYQLRVTPGSRGISVEEEDDFSPAETEESHETRQGRSNFPTIRKKKKKIRLEPESCNLICT